jgi:hypothetical protein
MAAVSARRPSRAALEAAVRASGGNLSRTAGALGCSRTSLYTWVYQLGLADVVGIRQSEEDHMPKPNGAGLIPTAVKLPEELWKRVRHRAIDEDRTASDVVRDAIELYLLDGKKAPR